MNREGLVIADGARGEVVGKGHTSERGSQGDVEGEVVAGCYAAGDFAGLISRHGCAQREVQQRVAAPVHAAQVKREFPVCAASPAIRV